jgi:hypothetical protein
MKLKNENVFSLHHLLCPSVASVARVWFQTPTVYLWRQEKHQENKVRTIGSPQTRSLSDRECRTTLYNMHFVSPSIRQSVWSSVYPFVHPSVTRPSICLSLHSSPDDDVTLNRSVYSVKSINHAQSGRRSLHESLPHAITSFDFWYIKWTER